MKVLEEYKHKRNFKKTGEPTAVLKKDKSKNLMFVVQEHHASHLHYDFRLEHDGVLKSWSVPKGPSPDPKDKRLAVEVEDHPYDYGSFEGVIPDAEYGGGEVFIWDTGAWIPEGDVTEALQKGKLDFTLKGKRMKGRWSLVRIRGRSTKPNWLLFKREDQYANDGSKYVRIKEYGSKKEKNWVKKDRSVGREMVKRSSKLPDFIKPELALLVDEVPSGSNWIHEMKFDGYRIQAQVSDGEVILRTRSSQDWTEKYKATAQLLSKLKVKNAIFDGEIVALDQEGKSDFQALQLAMKEGTTADLVYYIFDLLYLNGEDLREKPLSERKARLLKIITSLKSKQIHYSDHVHSKGAEFFTSSCSQDLEGIISKDIESPYRSGRTQDWVKTKCLKRQEFVIGGFTDGQGARFHFGALLLGVYRDGKLQYVGKCGTGFNAKTLGSVKKRLLALEHKTSPFQLKSPKEERGIHWTAPQLVAEVKFAMWTRDNILRVPVFQGLREDKNPKEIVKEIPKKMAEIKTELPELTHPDKILFEEEKITKADVADFYASPWVAPWIVPQIANRPLALMRCPAGAKAKCFFQKHFAHVPSKGKDGKSSPLHEIKIKESSGIKGYITVDSVEGLIALVQMGAFELHSWGCKQPDVEHPDQIVMDFDPAPDVPFARVKEAALDLKKNLDRLNLKSFLKVTGGKGLHVHVPIATRYTWAQVKKFSKILAEEMTERSPDLYTATLSKSARTGKIFIDYLRNGRSATAVVPYAIRAKTKSAVAMPIEWSELSTLKDPGQFTLKKSLVYLKARKKDPWAAYYDLNQKISILE